MDKQKQIDEMAKDMGIAFQISSTTRFTEISEVLVDAGYRKIPDGAVVLTRDENEKLLEWLELNMSKARKETAEKFAERLKSKLFDYGNIFTKNDIDEICKEFTECGGQ